MLVFLVRNREDDEYKIGVAVCERPADWDPTTDNIVRATKRNMIEGLRHYYQTEGIEDEVLIDFPAGYVPTFTPNISARLSRHYEIGLSLLSKQAPHWVLAAINQFDSALLLDGQFARSHAAKAEAFCTLAMYDYKIDPRAILPQAEGAAREALRLAPDLWHGHAALGTVHLFQREWQLAERSFNDALTCDCSETLLYQWYAAFLLSRDRQVEALDLIMARVVRLSSDPMAHATLALYLYLLQRFSEAELAVSNAVGLDEECWLGYFVRALILLHNDREQACFSPEQALEALKQTESILRYPLSPGLVAGCIESMNRDKLPLERLKNLAFERIQSEKRNGGYVKPREFALARDGFECYSLEFACDHLDPFMIWGHLWPILYEARWQGRYVDVVRRMNEPFDPTRPAGRI